MPRKQQEYHLIITCPLCGAVATRASSAPFIYLDADGIDTHSQHIPDCQADAAIAYQVVREPLVYRQLPGDPQPPEGGV